EKLLPEYLAAPKVTRDRLYLETMEQVYSNTSKVLVDVKNGNNIMYLPLDKMLSSGSTNSSAGSIPLMPSRSSTDNSSQNRSTDTTRSTAVRSGGRG
ncbi:MAG: protease modulator HflK, partial [Gammaproteobacteria bacterium]|nr:protease modulator HflK [Gammaproteobacteria bacterium]